MFQYNNFVHCINLKYNILDLYWLYRERWLFAVSEFAVFCQNVSTANYDLEINIEDCKLKIVWTTALMVREKY